MERVEARPEPTSDEAADDAADVERAVALAAELVERSHGATTRRERARSERMARLLDDPAGRELILDLTDEVMRVDDDRRAAGLFAEALDRTGLPAFAGPIDRLALWASHRLAPRLPRLVMPVVRARMRAESRGTIVRGEDPAFRRYLARRHAAGMEVNVNVLGEAILGEDEAAARVDAILGQLRRPDVDYVSVKVSAVTSRLGLVAFDATVDGVVERLRPLFLEAARHDLPKFVNLDMEEYRDLHLTAAAFERALDGLDLAHLDAGIALQAYLPDTATVLDHLGRWAVHRHAAGGGRTKVRLVKGANLAMESVEAELRGWPAAPFATKAEVDANYKRLLDQLLAPELDPAVRIGIASHNLFEVAWALVRAERAGALHRVELEMLEGMAPAEARAVRQQSGRLRLYAPVAARDHFDTAIAYLVRRLDENTGPENYLRHVATLAPGSETWLDEERRFRTAVVERNKPAVASRRTQDRNRTPAAMDPAVAFANEPDTDFTQAANRRWLRAALERPLPTEIPAVVAGEELAAPMTGEGIDPSAPGRPLYRFTQATVADVDRAVAAARGARGSWSGVPTDERRALLSRVGDVMAARRGEAIAAMVHDAGKVATEADVEVSEAIDSARYYARDDIRAVAADLRADPLGVVVVAPPWNFPYAIPAGGVLAALAAGNTVILKPAPESVLTAHLVAEHCWAAGVPRDALQFVPCDDASGGTHLIRHPDVDAVVLTGSWETAAMFLDWRPDLHLHAETSGKNAVVVTAAADLDLAVRDVVRSAFGHAGQKCSAASLIIVERSLAESGRFLPRLRDAARSLVVGPAADPRTDMGPLLRPPEGVLARALTQLDAGEQWLLEPAPVGDNPHLWSPGIRLGVRPGSWFHQTECFGPVLGVVTVDDLDEAVTVQNSTPYGLTGGIHSLDEAEVARWLDRVEVGNAYVNRGITGAIVRRQPFGGWKRSSVGGGPKAGGPDQVASLLRWSAPTVDLEAAARSFSRWWEIEFSREHDPSGLRAEANVLRYRPLDGPVLVRASPATTDDELAAIGAAASTAGAALVLSTPIERTLSGPSAIVVEDDETLAARLAAARLARVRFLDERAATETVRRAAHLAGLTTVVQPVVPNGRIELARWVREQAVSTTRHRHGNLRASRVRSGGREAHSGA